MNFKPLSKYIFIIEIDEEESTTQSGIIIPEYSRDKNYVFGTVIDIGDEVKSIKKDDVVLFDKYIKKDVRIDNKDYALLMEKDIIAIKK